MNFVAFINVMSDRCQILFIGPPLTYVCYALICVNISCFVVF
jgi:hypothetical protein